VPPRLDSTEAAKRNYLKKPIRQRARFVVVSDKSDQILRDAVSGPEDVAELELLKDSIITPRWRVPASATLKHLLPLRGKVPVKIKNLLTGIWWTLHGFSLLSSSTLPIKHTSPMEIEIPRIVEKNTGRDTLTKRIPKTTITGEVIKHDRSSDDYTLLDHINCCACRSVVIRVNKGQDYCLVIEAVTCLRDVADNDLNVLSS
jgi:hypothetical protein